MSMGLLFSMVVFWIKFKDGRVLYSLLVLKVNNASMCAFVCSHSLDAVSVRFVLHDGVWWQVEDSAKRVSDASSSGLITCRFVPDRYDILLHTHTHTPLN